MSNILVVDDDLEICDTLESLVVRQSHVCDSVQSLSAGRERLAHGEYDVVFLDVRLPDGNGLDLLVECTGMKNPPEVIILTGKGDAAGAEIAIERGVWDYVLKPSSVQEISSTLGRALRYRAEKQENSRHRDMSTGGIVGESPEMKSAFTALFQAAGSGVNLLLTGETGTGKEVFARTVHNNSARKNQNFVVVDCASLNESLLEATLFGHRKGAFTGAYENRQGLIKVADGGTLFLDELGEMPLSLQKSFLRLLQERTFRSLGDSKEQTSDFRLIAATNRDLDAMVEEGTFRRDLLYRVKGMSIRLPALRCRRGDVQALVHHRLQQLSLHTGDDVKEVGACFLETLSHYDWPGNVRELFNIVERAVIAAGDETKVYAMHLPRALRITVTQKQILDRSEKGSVDVSTVRVDEMANEPVLKSGQHPLEACLAEPLPGLKDFKTLAEKHYIKELVDRQASDLASILTISGLSRSHFYSLLKKHNLSL